MTLVRPPPRRPAAPARTASGPWRCPDARARVARPSRILVEGIHDAELVEKVWGDDLRIEGIVVERLDGIDVLPEVIRRFGPDAEARLGVLVDHLLPGTKEWRIVEAGRWSHVRVTGTPFVDVWQAIKPGVVGLPAWPTIERSRPWKEGICEVFGEPVPGRLWKKLLAPSGPIPIWSRRWSEPSSLSSTLSPPGSRPACDRRPGAAPWGVDPYAVLGVTGNATPEQIASAHRQAVLRTHPDRGGTAEEFREVQTAFELLSDPRTAGPVTTGSG